jgi:hypothetical protein
MTTVNRFLFSTILVIFSLGTAMAVAPTNPPVDPRPADNEPYPPTDALLYYDYQQGGILPSAPDFLIPVGVGPVVVKLVPKNPEQYAVGYYSDFYPGMSISPALMTAIEQTNGGGVKIWPNWIGDSSAPGYDSGEESSYWNGRRYYYEDLPWPQGDKDLDDLWVDIAWKTGVDSVEIRISVPVNSAGYLNPFEITFERAAGEDAIDFSYIIHEPSAGPDSSGHFILEDGNQTMTIFESGDVGDWATLYGHVPLIPVFALPIATILAGVMIRKRTSP